MKTDTNIPAIRCGTAIWSSTPADVPSLDFATGGDDVPFGAAAVAVDGLGSAKMEASEEFAGKFRSSACYHLHINSLDINMYIHGKVTIICKKKRSKYYNVVLIVCPDKL